MGQELLICTVQREKSKYISLKKDKWGELSKSLNELISYQKESLRWLERIKSIIGYEKSSIESFVERDLNLI